MSNVSSLQVAIYVYSIRVALERCVLYVHKTV